MDRRLVDWARAVKAGWPHGPPPLWLFTDARRLPDPLPAARRLPPGLAGIVFRHDLDENRARLGLELARVCQARRLALVVAMCVWRTGCGLASI
jgi:thiamine-phosphate pyrophosphorylase